MYTWKCLHTRIRIIKIENFNTFLGSEVELNRVNRECYVEFGILNDCLIRKKFGIGKNCTTRPPSHPLPSYLVRATCTSMLQATKVSRPVMQIKKSNK